LGDISTALLFALFAEWIYLDTRDRSASFPLLATASITLFIILLPVFYLIARKNSFTNKLVHSGWTPVITAMILSSGGGLFLDTAVGRYDKLPPFQPVICGVGGNLVALPASRISTSLHINAKLGQLPFGINRFSTPLKVFFNRKGIIGLFDLILIISFDLKIFKQNQIKLSLNN
jgi:solute carrier family 41